MSSLDSVPGDKHGGPELGEGLLQFLVVLPGADRGQWSLTQTHNDCLDWPLISPLLVSIWPLINYN